MVLFSVMIGAMPGILKSASDLKSCALAYMFGKKLILKRIGAAKLPLPRSPDT